MRRDLSLVNSCSSLHFPLAAGLLGVLARELVSDFRVDMARPDCSATLAELAATRLGHYYKTSVNRKSRSKCGAYPERRGSAARGFATAFVRLFLGAILTAKQRRERCPSEQESNVFRMVRSTQIARLDGEELSGDVVRRWSADVKVN